MATPRDIPAPPPLWDPLRGGPHEEPYKPFHFTEPPDYAEEQRTHLSVARAAMSGPLGDRWGEPLPGESAAARELDEREQDYARALGGGLPDAPPPVPGGDRKPFRV